jgi:NO-binding membrane sensor protein with MHYT domain
MAAVAEVNQFSYGWISPVLAGVMSTLGCLLGIMLAIKARARPGRGHTRLLGYAAVAVGGVGVFQAYAVTLSGFTLRDSILRYDPTDLAIGLGLAIVLVGTGTFVAGSGTVHLGRLLLASVLMGVGVAGTQLMGTGAIRVSGTVHYEPTRLGASICGAVLVAGLAPWLIANVQRFRSAAAGSLAMGLGICGVANLGLSAVRIHLYPYGTVVGLHPMVLLGPVVLASGALTAMLWFFTVGTSTRHDLDTMLLEPDHSIEIEPWMINEVMARTAVGIAHPEESVMDSPSVASGQWWRRRPDHVSIRPVWRYLPARQAPRVPIPTAVELPSRTRRPHRYPPGAATGFKPAARGHETPG